jgi:hypothetical protein
MKRLVAIMMPVVLAAMAGAAITLIPTKAVGGEIRLAEQSCDTKAAAQKLTGAEKDNFIAKCQVEANITPPDVPITTAVGVVADRRGQYGLQVSLQDFIDDCVSEAAERGLTGDASEAVIAECIKGHPTKGHPVDLAKADAE